MPTKLRSAVATLLGEDSPFARRIAWVASEEQLDYANRVCSLLEARRADPSVGTALGTLEAATGIGKTFGYLVPLLAYAHISGRRVAVATYTLDLLHSLHSEAVPLADEVVSEYLGTAPLRRALRVGMQEYVSAQRVHELLAELPGGHPATDTLQALGKFAKEGQDGLNSGLLRDWLQQGFALPSAITADKVQMRAWCSKADRAAYLRQGEVASEAGLVLTTQATVLLHCMRHVDMISGTDELPDIDAVVVDEADRVPGMAESVTGGYLPLNALAALVSSLDNGRRPAVRAARERLAQVKQSLHDLLPTHAPTRTLLHGNNGAAARPTVVESIGVIKDVLSLLRRQSIVKDNPELSDRISGWVSELRLFTGVLDGERGSRVAYVQQSPVRSYLGLGVQAMDPGRVLSQMWKREPGDGGVRALLMTSATLAPPGEAGMAAFHREVGIIPSVHRVIEEACGQIEPRHHGHLDIVLADPRAPRPFAGMDPDQEEAAVQDDWLCYVADMVEAARAQGGRTMVLTGAYRDSDRICDVLRERGLVPVQARRGNKAAEITEFLSSGDSVWVTPSAWEGVDLPGAISHLVIARIPYRSIDSGTGAAFKEMLLARGLDEVGAAKIAASRHRGEVARKLRQGIGRPLRRRDDKATLWVADARFPLPISLRDAWIRKNRREKVGQGDSSLLGVIPTRFRAKQPSIFGLDKNLWRPE